MCKSVNFLIILILCTYVVLIPIAQNKPYCPKQNPCFTSYTPQYNFTFEYSRHSQNWCVCSPFTPFFLVRKHKRKYKYVKIVSFSVYKLVHKTYSKLKAYITKTKLTFSLQINPNRKYQQLLFIIVFISLITPVQATPSSQAPSTCYHLVPLLASFVSNFVTLPSSTPPTVDNFKLKIISQNINRGIFNKNHLINNLLCENNVDIFTIQEVGIPKSLSTTLESKFKNYKVFHNLYNDDGYSPPRTSKLGARYLPNKTPVRYKWGTLTILSKELGEYATAVPTPSANGRLNTVRINKPGLTELFIVNFYAPADDRTKNEKFLRLLKKHVNELYGKSPNAAVVLCGDANSIISELDSNNNNNQNYNCNMLVNHEFTFDLLRLHHPTAEKYTHYQSHLGNTYKKRIDFILSSPNLASLCTSCDIGTKNEIHSDHRAVLAEFSIPLNQPITRANNTSFELPIEHYINKYLTNETKHLNKKDWKQYKLKLTTLINNNNNNILDLAAAIEQAPHACSLDDYLTAINTNAIQALTETLDSKLDGKFKAEFSKFLTNASAVNLLPKFTTGPTLKLKNKAFDLLKIRTHLYKLQYHPSTKPSKYLLRLVSKHNLKLNHNPFNKESVKHSINIINEALKNNKKLIHTNINTLRKQALDAQHQSQAADWANPTQLYNKIKSKFQLRKSITLATKQYCEAHNIPLAESSNPKHIKNMVAEFWCNMFTSKKNKPNHTPPWLTNIKLNTEFTNDTNNILNPISEDEYESIARKSSARRAPGIDGITNELLKNAPPNFNNHMVRLYNNCISQSSFPETWKTSRVYLIHKKDDKNDPSNYRPIALLSNSYKILTKIITKRTYITCEKHKLFCDLQGGFRAKNTTHHKIRTLLNVYEDSLENDKELHVCFIDLEKAFDSVEHWALIQVMEAFGFGDQFIRLIISLNSNVSSDVITDYGTTDKFSTTRGVRQGCPFSPLLFILFMEPLLKYIKTNSTGYTLNSHAHINVPILAFADDLAITANNYTSLTNSLNLLQTYCDYYAIKISNKSAYTYRGKSGVKYPAHKPPTLNGNTIEYLTPNQPYRYLGIHMSLTLNWDFHIQQITTKYTRSLNLISNANIDPRLKVRCINTVSYPALTYSFPTVKIPTYKLTKLENQAKKIVKNAMRISLFASSHKLWAPTNLGGLGLKRLTHLYAEYKITDLFTTLNFTPLDTIAYKTTQARIHDITIKDPNALTSDKIISKFSNNHIQHAINTAKKLEIRIIPPKPTTKTTITLLKAAKTLNLDNRCKKTLNKLKKHGATVLEDIAPNNKLLSLTEVKNKFSTKYITDYQWTHITTNLCLPNTSSISPKVIGIAANTSWLTAQKDKFFTTVAARYNSINIYTDGSYHRNENKAGCGVWSAENDKSLAFACHGKQTIYHAELQAIIAALLLPHNNTNINIHTDSQNCIDFISEAPYWTAADWEIVPHLRTQKLLINLLNFSKSLNNKVKFTKVKSHTNILGNDNADSLAKIGRKATITIFNENDLPHFEHFYALSKNGDTVNNNFREFVQKTNTLLFENELKTKNEVSGLFPEFSYNINNTVSHFYLSSSNKDVPTVRTVYKARQNKLATASEMHSRKDPSFTNPFCIFCNNITETTEHVLCHCPKYAKTRAHTLQLVREFLISQTKTKYHDNIQKNSQWWFTNEDVTDLTSPTALNSPLTTNIPVFLGALGFFPQDIVDNIKPMLSKKSKSTRTLSNLNNIIINSISVIWKERNREWDNHLKTIKTQVKIELLSLIPTLHSLTISDNTNNTSPPPSTTTKHKRKRKRKQNHNTINTTTPSYKKHKTKDTLSPKFSKARTQITDNFNNHKNEQTHHNKNKRNNEIPTNITASKKQRLQIDNFLSSLPQPSHFVPTTIHTHNYTFTSNFNLPTSTTTPPSNNLPSPTPSPQPNPISNNNNNNPKPNKRKTTQTSDSPPPSPLIDNRRKKRKGPT